MDAAPILSIPTFVAGPENEGRGYGVLAQSGPPAQAGWTIDLPMALFEWAKLERAVPFVACLPVSAETVVVCRARFFRRTPIGHLSYLNGALLSQDACHQLGWRTELVAALIADPDETLDFARRPLELAVPPAVLPADWPGLGLAWTNRIIAVEAPLAPEAILLQALASIDPPEQRERVTGWITTVELPPRGVISPLRQCQLVALQSPAPAVTGFLPVTVRADGSTAGDPVALPPPRAMWERLLLALVALPEIAGDPGTLRWRPSMSAASPGEVATDLLRGAARLLDDATMIALLQNIVLRGDAELRGPAVRVLEEQLGAIPRQGSAAIAVARLAPLLRGEDHALAHRILSHIDPAGLETLPATALTELLQIAIGFLHTAGGATDRGRLRPLAEIALVYGDRCEAEGLPLAPLSDLVELWPDDNADMLDGVMTERLVGAIRTRGRAVLAAATRKLVRSASQQIRGRPARREELLRSLGALLAAIRLMEEASE